VLSALLWVSLLAGCSDDPGALFVDVRWQVKCPPGNGNCLPSSHRAHDVFTTNGGLTNEDPPLIVATACELESVGSDTLRWSFSAATSEYRITIRNAEIPRVGGAVGGSACSVEIVDDVNTYVGACGSAPLSAAQPCRLSSVGFAMEDRVMGLFGPTLSTSLVCEGIRSPTTSILVRNVYAPDVRGESVNGLVPINIVNCNGNPAQ
jgi:hypothetical protein